MTSEAEKLASHLSLLRAEYVKLQQKCSRLERELAVASAQAGNTQEDSFVCRLLSLVSSLHSETMRDRQWAMLMVLTKKNSDKGPGFCCRDLLQLELHHFAEDVSEIVDQSERET